MKTHKKLLFSLLIFLAGIIALQGIAVAQDEYEFVSKIPAEHWIFRWPTGVDVDSAGNFYVANNSTIQKFDPNGVLITEWGSYGTGDGQFSGYFLEIAFDSSGNIFVVDSGNNCVQKFDSNGNFITKWGNSGYGDYNFVYPSGIAVDSFGNVYVADQWNSRIMKYDSNGNYLLQWGGGAFSYDCHNGDGELCYPGDIAIDANGVVYVADSDNARVQKFDSNGNYLGKWGSNGSGNGQFIWPHEISVDSSGYVYVFDNTHGIQKFDSNGIYIKQWGSSGTDYDIYHFFAQDIAVDSSGNVYVTDTNHQRILKFTTDGTFITKWGPTHGTGDGEFYYPYDVAVDSNGNIYVADQRNCRIQKFDTNGNFMWQRGGECCSYPDNMYYMCEECTGGGEFKRVDGIAVDSSGNVYAVDKYNHRIQKFDTNGNFLFNWGSYGAGNGQFSYPTDVAVDSNGFVYVTDTNNNRIQKFYSTGQFCNIIDVNGTLDSPDGIAVDSNGNIYTTINGHYQSCVLKIDASGAVDSTWSVCFVLHGSTNGLAVDSSDNVYIAGSYRNHLIKIYNSDGTFITSFGAAGNPSAITGGYHDGKLNAPHGVAVDSSGNVYVADTHNNRIQKFRPVSANQPPVANAGDNLAILSQDQNITVIQGTDSDPDNDPLTYRWLEGETVLLDSTAVGENGEAWLDLSLVQGFSIGDHYLTLELSDGQATSTDEMILTVSNSAPHPAPTGGGIYQIGDPVTLGGQVSDFDGDQVSYDWLEGETLLFSGQVQTNYGGNPAYLPEHTMPYLSLGTHTVTLRVNDGTNDPVTRDITIEVIDATAPTLAPVPDKTILWPPNHNMVDIEILANASDNSGGSVSLLAAVSSNEPEDGLGDGDMTPDWTEPVINQDTGEITLQLRAERSGSGDGRVYTITITATDDSGNSSTTDVEIIVPHDNKK